MKIKTASMESLEEAIAIGVNQFLNEKYECKINNISFESREADDFWGEEVKINLTLKELR